MAAGGFINATTSPGLPGPADIYAFYADGSMEVVREEFSDGPTNLETTPNMSTEEGGANQRGGKSGAYRDSKAGGK